MIIETLTGYGIKRTSGYMEMTIDSLLKELRRQCEDAGGQSAWAKKHDMSPSYVSDVLLGKRAPGPLIYTALGFVPVLTFSKGK